MVSSLLLLKYIKNISYIHKLVKHKNYSIYQDIINYLQYYSKFRLKHLFAICYNQEQQGLLEADLEQGQEEEEEEEALKKKKKFIAHQLVGLGQKIGMLMITIYGIFFLKIYKIIHIE